MNWLRLGLVLYLVSLIAAPASFADIEITSRGSLVKFEDVVKYALKGDASIQAAEARLKKEKELYQAVKRGVFPKLATNLYSAGATGDRRGIIFWGSELRIPIFEGGRRFHERKKKSIEVSLEESNLGLIRESVIYELKALFVAALLERENTKSAQDWVKEARRLYLSMKSLFEKELVNREALYRSEVAYRTAQSELVRHREAMDYAEALIRETLQMPSRKRLLLEPLASSAPFPVDLEESLSRMRTHNSLYERTRLELKVKEEEVKILKTERFPKLGLTTRFNLARDTYVDQNRFEAGLISSWNVWDFGVLSHQIKAKQAELEEMRHDGRAKVSRLEHELRKLHGDLKEAQAKIKAAHAHFKEKKESYQNDKTRLITGEGSEVHVFDSFTQWTKAQMALAESLARYRLELAHFEQLTGMEMALVAKKN